MKLRHLRAGGRKGFTLLELLIVIAIIALLVGLLSAAIARALSRANEARNHSDINQLAIALESFKAKYGFYPPSRIRLWRRLASYDNANTYERDSAYYIRTMFPRMPYNPGLAAGLQVTVPAVNWIDDPIMGSYNSPDYNAAVPRASGVAINYSASDEPWDLEGDQCLVFFLGGRPSSHDGAGNVINPPGCLGFSSSPVTAVLAPGETPVSFFDFSSRRLVRIARAHPLVDPWAGGSPTSENGFLSYLDAYGLADNTGHIVPNQGQPYAYFSANRPPETYLRYGASDCPTLGLVPYSDNLVPARFYKDNTFQIISAGRNLHFGGGGTWTPANAAAKYPPADPGNDDQCNFYDKTLGTPN